MNDPFDCDRFISSQELRTLVPYHPTHLARLEAIGEFPKRIWLGRSRVGWSLYEVLVWMQERKAERDT